MVPQVGRKCEGARPFQSLLEHQAQGGVIVGLDGISFFLFLLLLIKRGRMCTERQPLEQSRPTACLGGETYYTTSIKFLIDRIPAFRRTMESPGGSLEVGGHLSQYHAVQLPMGKSAIQVVANSSVHLRKKPRIQGMWESPL